MSHFRSVFAIGENELYGISKQSVCPGRKYPWLEETNSVVPGYRGFRCATKIVDALNRVSAKWLFCCVTEDDGVKDGDVTWVNRLKIERVIALTPDFNFNLSYGMAKILWETEYQDDKPNTKALLEALSEHPNPLSSNTFLCDNKYYDLVSRTWKEAGVVGRVAHSASGFTARAGEVLIYPNAPALPWTFPNKHKHNAEAIAALLISESRE